MADFQANSPLDDPADVHLDRLFDEISAKVEAGESVDVDSYARRYPEYAERIRDLIQATQAIVMLGRSTSIGASQTSAPVPEEFVSGILGDFRLIRQIGRGGMGVVFEAEQMSLGRRVALKVLPFASVLQPTQLQRFRNEIQIAATLEHPHIARVLAVGCDRGVHHFAMQLIDGQSLAEVISQLQDLDTSSQRSLPPLPRGGEGNGEAGEGTTPASPDTTRIAWAHVSTVGPVSTSEYFRSVARLGIQTAEALQHAHAQGIIHRDVKPSNLMVDASGYLYVMDFGLARAQTDTGLTMSGDVLGTLRYMSPEQASGDTGAVDHRSDIYSLGVTLYELLTLRPAFVAEDRYQLLQGVAHEQPVPPRRVNEAIPAGLEAIVLKAMARDPKLRYATAQELADDLSRYLAGEEIQAAELSESRAASPRIHRMAGFARRHPVWSAAALLLVSIVTAAAPLLTNQWPWAAAARDASALNDRGVELASRGDLEQALDDFSRAIQLGPPRAECYNNRGVMYASRGELELASADFDESLRIDPEFAAAIANRAITRARMGQVDEALQDVSALISLPPLPQAGEGAGVVCFIDIDEEPTEPLRAFRARAAELIGVSRERTDETDGADTSETTEAGESALATTALTGPASTERMVCAPGKMTAVIISQTIDLNQREYHAMLVTEMKKRRDDRRRQLRLEPLEPRRLLTSDPGWLFGIGGVAGNVGATDLDLDGAGNAYVSGSVSAGTFDFDPGPGVTELSGPAAFVAKYAPDGTFLWVNDARGTDFFYPCNTVVDAGGNTYWVGEFRGTATFGDTMLTSQGDSDAYVAKIDADGNFIWVVQAGSAGADRANNLDVDTTGHIYVAGHFTGTITLGSYELVSNGDLDGFVAKLDSAGQVVWARGMGGVDFDRALGVKVASDGLVYLAVWFRGTTNIGGHELVSAGEIDTAIAGLNSSDGTALWAQRLGGPANDYLRVHSVDADNNVVAGGAFSGVADFGSFQLTSSSVDGVVLIMDSAGTVIWARGTESVADSTANVNGVALDGNGDIYVTGAFDGMVDFAPGSSVTLLVEAGGGNDGYLWKLDASGNFVSAKRVGGPGRDASAKVAADGNGNVCLVGIFGYEVASRPLTATFPNGNLMLVGSGDVFVLKLPAHMLETHIVLFSDSFENGQWGGKWVQDRQKDWFTSTQRATLGTYSAEVDGSASDAALTVASSIDLTPYGSAELTFDWYIESALDAGEYLAVDLFNGTTWTEVARLFGDVDAEDVWHQPYVQIPEEFLVSNFQFRFRAKMSGSDEDANLDNVQLVATSLAGPPNQLPMAVDDAATTAEDTATTIPVLGNDSDPDLDVLHVESVTQGSHGAVVVNGDNTVTYTPQANYFGSDSFTYTISDGRGGTDTANVLVTITAVNDAPVAVDDAASTPHDTSLVIAPLDNDTDVDTSPLLIESLGIPAHGTVLDNGDGTVTYTPAPGYIGSDSFEYVVTDGSLSDTATVTIDVQPDEVTLVYSNTTAKTIKDRATTTSTISVPDAMNIVDVNVQLNISHTRDQDLDVYLIGPDGTRVELFTDVGGNGDHFTGTILDDQASTSLTAGSAPFAGTYRPEGSLSALSDKNALGTWTLEITDDAWLYSGTLNSWSITITGEPMALTAAASAAGTASDVAPLTQAEAQRAVDQALLWWSAYAHVPASAPFQVYVSDLPACRLGLAWGRSLTLDANADGAGWFVDRAPWDHSEFVSAGASAAQRTDLLTVVAHEVGHLLGANHSDNGTDLMADTLPLGTRRLPGLGQVGWRASLLDAIAPPASLESILDFQARPIASLTAPDTASSDWNQLLAPLVAAHVQRIGIAEEVRRARLRADALDESAALLEDDLLDLLARQC